jgi:hypothetical protein
MVEEMNVGATTYRAILIFQIQTHVPIINVPIWQCNSRESSDVGLQTSAVWRIILPQRHCGTEFHGDGFAVRFHAEALRTRRDGFAI